MEQLCFSYFVLDSLNLIKLAKFNWNQSSISGGSRIFVGGGTYPQAGAPGYNFIKTFPKTV